MAAQVVGNPSAETTAGKLRTMYRNNSSIVGDCALINIRRLFYLSLIAIPMRVLSIYMFAGASAAPEAWHQGIFLSHVVLLVFYTGVFLVTYRLKNSRQATLTVYALQYIIPVLIMASGIIIVTIDQLVTASITPVMIVSIVFGAVFVIRPLVSAPIYFISYLVYYHSIALTIASPEVLLSNRVNGATILALGFLISFMSWFYNYTNITQKRRIERQQKQLAQMAYYDSLTNLRNRHYFDIAFEKELSAVKRYGRQSVLIILDIDDFKRINDAHGHLTGDEVLKQLSQVISGNIRKSDTVCRFGGEEFVILAPNTSLREGLALAEKLRKLVAEKAFIAGSTTARVTASFGVSLLQTGSHGAVRSFSRADKALYRAKKQGKNKVEKAS